MRKVRTYSVATMVKTLKEAMKTAERGLKVIIADGECQLARQRRVRAEEADKLKRGERVVRVRYGVDDEICTGDHSCIRLSACPSLTVKPNPDPLRSDPVATVIESCVGCGLCGEVAHAAVLCPSFYRAEIIRNPQSAGTARCTALRRTVIGMVLDPSPSPPRGGPGSGIEADARTRPLTLLIAALGGEGGGVLTNWIIAAAADCGLPAQIDLDPRRRAAHRRHHLLHRDRADALARACGPPAGARAHPGHRRHRRGGGERADGSLARGRERLRHARPHVDGRLDQPLPTR